MRRLEIPDRVRVLGFLPNGAVATQTDSRFEPTAVAVQSVETGQSVRTFNDLRPVRVAHYFTSGNARDDVRRFGVLLSEGWGWDGDGIYAVDLAAGKQRFVTGMHGGYTIRLHPTKPWVIVVGGQNGPAGCHDRIAVYDFVSGKRLLNRGGFEDQEFTCGDACFVGATEELVLTIRTNPPYRERGGTYERYTLGGDNPVLRASFQIPLLGANPSAASNGMVVFTDMLDDASFDVVAAPEGRIALSDLPRDQRRSPPPGPLVIPPPAFLSPSGDAVVGGLAPSVWNLKTKKLLWRGLSDRWVRGAPDGDRFGVFEDWGKLIGQRNQYVTVAWRSAETGRVIFRCLSKDYRPWEYISADGKLAVNTDGTIQELPYRVNWLLLALCQAILALPLILLWARPYWRRRRITAAQETKTAGGTPAE